MAAGRSYQYMNAVDAVSAQKTMQACLGVIYAASRAAASAIMSTISTGATRARHAVTSTV
jgi:hypothetical protein